MIATHTRNTVPGTKFLSLEYSKKYINCTSLCNNNFFVQHHVKLSCMLNESTFHASLYKMYSATCMLHKTIFSTTLPRNMAHILATRVQAILNKILERCCAKNGWRPCYTSQLLNISHVASF